MKKWPKNFNVKLLNQTRTFASSAVNLAKLPHIFMMIWRPPMTAPPGVAGAPRASLRHWPPCTRFLICAYLAQNIVTSFKFIAP